VSATTAGPLYFEDLPIGYESIVGTYELSAGEIIELARRWDPQPFHVDEAAAKNSVFGGLVASSLHLFAICTRLFFDHADAIKTVAMLGKDKIRLPSPARAGSTLTYVTRCIDRRESKGRPEVGIVTLEDELTDEQGNTVLTQQVTLMVARKPGAP
jgi:acyl dehydratase